MFTDTNLPQISNIVREQFPQFYEEHGPGFIEFIRVYYEWLESQGNVINQARTRYKQFDIDTTAEEFLEHFKSKYMSGLPTELLGNQRLLQKHIIELYRSKGSEDGIRLLFRLLFNEEIDFYVPSYDIFKLSDNTWISPKYLEVTDSSHFLEMIGQPIRGSISGATAIVENFERRTVGGQTFSIMFISNLRGEWQPGERVLCGDFDPIELPVVRGSVVGVNINTSINGIEVGDTLVSQNTEYPIRIVVTETFSGSGSLEFNIVSGGTYYTKDADLIVYLPKAEDYIFSYADKQIMTPPSYGFPKMPSGGVDDPMGSMLYLESMGDDVITGAGVVTGAGADIEVLELSDTHQWDFSIDPLLPYKTTDIDADEYGFPKFPQSNIATIMDDSLYFQTMTVGTISKIRVNNPGFNYNTPVQVIAIDPYTSTSGILDANGAFAGQNAIITGIPSLGANLAKTAKVLSAGYNNTNTEPILFVGDANNQLSLTATLVIGGVGVKEGWFENTKSFLSDDKYLFDGHYYQDFSYVVRASMSLDKYIEILKLIAHPAGNALYGDIVIRNTNALYNKEEMARVHVGPRVPKGFSAGYDEGYGA